MAIEEAQSPARTAGEAGWHLSQYNLSAPVPGTNNVAIANLFKGTCAEYTPMELYMLSVIEELDEHYPMIERFARRGVICNFDERAALETFGRVKKPTWSVFSGDLAGAISSRAGQSRSCITWSGLLSVPNHKRKQSSSSSINSEFLLLYIRIFIVEIFGFPIVCAK